MKRIIPFKRKMRTDEKSNCFVGIEIDQEDDIIIKSVNPHKGFCSAVYIENDKSRAKSYNCFCNGTSNFMSFSILSTHFVYTEFDMEFELSNIYCDSNGMLNKVHSDQTFLIKEGEYLDLLNDKNVGKIEELLKLSSTSSGASFQELIDLMNMPEIHNKKKIAWAVERRLKIEQGIYKDNDMDYIPFYLEQERIKESVIKENAIYDDIKYIAGVDVAYNEIEQRMVGAIVVLDSQTLEIVDQATHEMDITFPYIPGLFSFREIPPILEAFKKIKVKPDLIVCDAHGIAHPKGVGMATHLGVELDIPTIGCAKKRLVGYYNKEELKKLRGSSQDMIWASEKVGVALRTQDNIKPMFVSIGHKIDLESSIEWVLKLCTKYRLPETTRQSDQLVNKVLKERTEIDFLDD